MRKVWRRAVAFAGFGIFAASGASAQDTAAVTAGGDITADEASVLPPVTIASPKEPLRRSSGAARRNLPSYPVEGPVPAGAGGEVGAANVASEGATAFEDGTGPGVFTLGQLDLIGGSTITNEAMYTHNKLSLDQAVAIIPGVSVQSAGGSRNERDIFVRGFDRQRVPLSIDGVRVYLPADNRLDFGRFLTPDLAEVQVQKGYVSVLNGPGGLGGAINLVSRKPAKDVELEGRSGVVFDGNNGSMNAWNAYAFAGTRQRGYYAQVSGTLMDQDHFNLSDDFTPVNLVNEDGGSRNNSEFDDWRINVKAGITPNATDEYAVNYTTQSGSKSAPLHTAGQAVSPQRYWRWPYWDIQTVSWLSKTAIDDKSYVKTNAYYNTFDNLLSAFNGPDYQFQTVTNNFNSYYDDYAYGGFVEAGTTLIPYNTLKGVVHYRRDNHSERSDIALDRVAPPPLREPWQESIVDTWSFAVENTYHATRQIDLVTGVSYDIDDVKQAREFANNAPVNNPLVSKDAWNGQGALVYSYSETGTAHASISSRTRFPTLFDRYSTRFDTRAANPNLDPERSTNYELGWSDFLIPGLKATTAVFYSDLKDSIQNAQVGASGGQSILGINVDGEHYGFEISADYDITPALRIGGNYTLLERKLDFAAAAATLPNGTPEQAQQRAAVAAAQEEGTPRHEAFLYLAWDITDQLTLTPSLEIASDRSSLITSAQSTLTNPLATRRPNYLRAGSSALLNIQAEYAFDANTSAAVGATNLLDENYALAEGFPEPGRQVFMNVRSKF